MIGSRGAEIRSRSKTSRPWIVQLSLIQRADTVFPTGDQHATVCETCCGVTASLDTHRGTLSWNCHSFLDLSVKRAIRWRCLSTADDRRNTREQSLAE